MMKDLEKLMSKKQEGKLSPQEMEAKMDVLRELLQMAQEAMGSKVKGGMDEMSKVSVMAPNAESLTAGLDMAKELAPAMEEEPSEDEPKVEAAPEESSEEVNSAPEDDEDDSLFGKRPQKKTTSSLMYDDE